MKNVSGFRVLSGCVTIYEVFQRVFICLMKEYLTLHFQMCTVCKVFSKSKGNKLSYRNVLWQKKDKVQGVFSHFIGNIECPSWLWKACEICFIGSRLWNVIFLWNLEKDTHLESSGRGPAFHVKVKSFGCNSISQSHFSFDQHLQ